MENTNEFWLPIKGFEGKFEISNLGNVKSLIRKGKLRKLKTDKMGYLFVNFLVNKKTKIKKAHRLVAEAFILNPNNKPCVNHKDGNKKNNIVDNLEWVTQKENIQHAVKNGLIKLGSDCKSSKLNEQQVLNIRELSKIKAYKEIADMYNMQAQHIRDIIKRRYWKHI